MIWRCSLIWVLRTCSEIDRDQVVDQLTSQDPLQGIGGPTIRARSKRMEEALQGLIMEMHDKVTVIEDSKTNSLITVTYLSMQDQDIYHEA